MSQPIRALVLDDEELSREFLQQFLQHSFPDLEVETRAEPDPSGDFDIYFVDNDFEGRAMAGDLARQIRSAGAEQLVIAFSGTLDSEILKDLIRAGCDGVCDKTVPTDLPEAARILSSFIQTLEETRASRPNGGLVGAIRSISDLLREWNQRLDEENAADEDGADS